MFNPWRTLHVKGAAHIPLLTDAREFSAYIIGGPDYCPLPPKYEDGPGVRPGGLMFACVNRHEEHVNSLFLEGSVRKVGLKELWRLQWYPGFDTNGPWTSSWDPPPIWPQWMRRFKDY